MACQVTRRTFGVSFLLFTSEVPCLDSLEEIVLDADVPKGMGHTRALNMVGGTEKSLQVHC
eukprot:6479053-Amphidinium_carterae.2